MEEPSEGLAGNRGNDPDANDFVSVPSDPYVCLLCQSNGAKDDQSVTCPRYKHVHPIPIPCRNLDDVPEPRVLYQHFVPLPTHGHQHHPLAV